MWEQDYLGTLMAQSSQGGTHPAILSPADTRLRELMKLAIGSEGSVETLLQNTINYTPAPGAVYPVSNVNASPSDPPHALPNGTWVTEFGNRLKDAAALLKLTTCKAVAVEIGGWDTHADQGRSATDRTRGWHQGLLAVLAAGLRAIYVDVNMGSSAVNLLMLVGSECGRTSRDNASLGTDHGLSGVMIAMGTRINPARQVCNMSVAGSVPDHWYDFDINSFENSTLPLPPNLMLHRTNYRTVLEEALQKHMQFGGNIDTIFKDFSVDKATNGTANLQFQQLNYLL
jgi:hypothetical protein